MRDEESSDCKPHGARLESPIAGPSRAVPPPVITTFSLDLSPDVQSWATGWGTALGRAMKVDVRTVPLFAARPKLVTVRIGQTPIAARSYVFPDSSGWAQPPCERPPRGTDAPALDPPATKIRHSPASARTRLRPPRDIIRLQDRLYYVLQPPLESLVSSGQISFPFRPFPYQYQGVAFLYPRYSAIKCLRNSSWSRDKKTF